MLLQMKTNKIIFIFFWKLVRRRWQRCCLVVSMPRDREKVKKYVFRLQKILPWSMPFLFHAITIDRLHSKIREKIRRYNGLGVDRQMTKPRQIYRREAEFVKYNTFISCIDTEYREPIFSSISQERENREYPRN